ncbi:MAG: SCO4848 family membrane protein [Aeromicrobium sp.]
MELPAGWSLVLIVTALWNLLIWPQFFKRIVTDDRARDSAGKPTKFLKVHAVLIGVSLSLGLAVGVLGILTIF